MEVFLEQQAQDTAIQQHKIRAGRKMSQQAEAREIKVSLDGNSDLVEGNAKPALAM